MVRSAKRITKFTSKSACGLGQGIGASGTHRSSMGTLGPQRWWALLWWRGYAFSRTHSGSLVAKCVPTFEPIENRPDINSHVLPSAALRVPLICNLGTKEGVTDQSNRFARVWPAKLAFFEKVRGEGGLLGVAVDPLTSHECGSQRYLAIRWLDL